MKYRFARSIRIAVVALLPACGGGDFTKTDGNGGHHAGADAAAEASGSGGTSGDGGSTGSGGKDSSGGAGSGGRQTGNGGRASGGNDGSGGSVDMGGSANDDAGTAGADSGAGTGGATNGGGTGSGGLASGGLGGGGGSCPDPITWYVDADQDGYGSTSAPTVKTCGTPMGHYSKVGGDCHDGMGEVHPQLSQQERKYFGTPYKASNGADSYDYDCSGVETGNPSQTKAASCVLSLGACGGTGYQPSNRGGATANPYCGSLKFQTCTGTALCTATVGQVMNPYACN